MERARVGPPSGTYVPDVCAIDDALHADAGSLTLVHRRFPGFCPYHIVHNLLGGHYSRHPECTATPFADVACRHGSHSRPDDAQEQSTHCPAIGSVVFLPLGLSYRAGCRGSLVVGCVECESYGAAMACAACRRQWEPEGPEVANASAIWTTIHAHMPDCLCGACPAAESGDDGGGGYDGAGYSEEDGEGEWKGEEEGAGEEEEEEWYDEEGQEGEEGWHGEEEWGGGDVEGDEEGAGAADGPNWGDGRWEQTADGTAWVVDYRSRASAPAPAPAPDTSVAVVAAAAAQAAVAAVMASGAGAAASEPLPATDSDWERRVRMLELESELAELKRVKRVRC